MSSNDGARLRYEIMPRVMCAMAMAGLTLLLGRPDVTSAAEIKIFSTRAIATVLDKVGPEFERTTGHRLNITTDIAIRMVRRIRDGEPVDFLVAAPGQMDALIKEGKIAYLEEGQSGVYLAGLLERLGVADAIGSKVTRPDTDIVSELVAKGEIELGMVVITQILTTPGVELVGPLPPEIQSYITFTGGVSTASREPNAARNLITFLAGPAALPVIRAQGMEPAR